MYVMSENSNEKTSFLSIRNFPRRILKGVDILATAEDKTRSEYIRRLLDKHIQDELPEEMLKKL